MREKFSTSWFLPFYTKIWNFNRIQLFNRFPLHNKAPVRPKITSRNQKRYKIFCILSTITYGTRKTPTFQKQWKRCKNMKPLYVQRSQWDSFLHKSGTLISFWEEFTSVKNKHKKINFFVVFFCAKNDEGENCQQRKALPSHPIRIAQFHEKSFFKSTEN